MGIGKTQINFGFIKAYTHSWHSAVADSAETPKVGSIMYFRIAKSLPNPICLPERNQMGRIDEINCCSKISKATKL